ncbi:MAG: NPCBM/NEW2 domain-containing protein, partial [Bacteroidota bacterium]|nr:NPCBM/NEW2 domain-containing protein [Bacteroidota bacterium]
LFVKDGGDGFDWDHVVWADPVLHGPKGDLKLTELKWLNATAGWGEAHVNRTCDNRPIVINDKQTEGIGTHAESVIVYQLPEGYDSFTATGYVTQEKGSVVFGVLVDKGTMDLSDKADVKVDFKAIGINGKARVRDLWGHKDLGIFQGTFSRELPQHGAGLYRLSTVKK